MSKRVQSINTRDRSKIHSIKEGYGVFIGTDKEYKNKSYKMVLQYIRIMESEENRVFKKAS